MVRHQEGRAERPDHLDLVALRQVAEIVRAARRRGRTRFTVSETLLARPLAVARARDRVQPRHGAACPWRRRPAAGCRWTGLRAPGTALVPKSSTMWRTSFSARAVGEAEVADDGRRGGLVAVVEVDRRLRGGRRRHRLAAERPCAPRSSSAADLVLERLDRGARRRALRHLLLHRQLVPGELLVERIGARAHDAPVVDRAGRARRDAGHAAVADVGIDDVVAVVVRDRVDRARLLAGVAADADLGVDQVLLERAFMAILGASSTSSTTVGAMRRDRHCRCVSVEAHVLEVAGLAVDADLRAARSSWRTCRARATGSISDCDEGAVRRASAATRPCSLPTPPRR